MKRATMCDPKKVKLYEDQKELLDLFLEKRAISKEQYEKSLGDLTRKMGMECAAMHECSKHIRKAEMKDLESIMQIYSTARGFMEAHGNPYQWGPTNWPPRQLIQLDIAAGESYVCVDDADELLGVFYFHVGEDPTYSVIEGSWLDDSTYGVVHRIASAGTVKGVGAFCINWAFEQCGHLRMDTHGDNYVMQNLLSRIGFTHCGTIYVEEDSFPRLAYEKSR